MELFNVWDKKTNDWIDCEQYALDNKDLNLIYCDMDGCAIQQDGSLMILDECGGCAYLDPARFEVRWNSRGGQ